MSHNNEQFRLTDKKAGDKLDNKHQNINKQEPRRLYNWLPNRR
jgi:hypothetical protein